jgi:two-component system chemotaxis response regulator CheY
MELKANMKILIVDDMVTIRQVLKKMLRAMGFTNFEDADDGATALPLIISAHEQGTPFEFVITDWNMPKMTGIDLVKTLRDDPRFETLPILMVTAEAEQSNVVVAVKAGVTNFIVKPFSAAVLKDKIDKIFKVSKK